MNTIDELRMKYANHEYMKTKLEAHINHLPILMKTIEEDYQKRTKKNQQLITRRDEFISEFMKNYPFSYIPQTEIYVDNKTISIVPEDYIRQLIGSKLERPLVVMKFKITQLLIKKIREQTIQQISFDGFSVTLPFSKTYASYFLTILGDIILNKHDSLIYYIDASYKPFLKTLNHSIYCLLNKSVVDVFKHKYHEHKYESCRVIPGVCQPIFNADPLHVIIASINLSLKYGSSDGFIQTKNLDKAMFLSKHTSESLVQYFLNCYFVQDESSITYKDVYFLWKTFLKYNSLPFVVSQQNFKLLISHLCDSEMCMKLMPISQLSLLYIKRFWDKYIVYDDESSYELQEIVDLYNDQHATRITIDTLRSVLLVEYPMINIDDTNILNIKCSLWNKELDIDNAISSSESHNLDEMYECYLEYTKKHSLKTVLKEYFENYVIL